MMSTDPLTFAKDGLGVGVGLVVMVWAFESIHWHNFMEANPQVGAISGSGMWLYYPLFMLGAVIAFTAFIRGLQRAVQGEAGG
ncbi:MAG: hypothetical protein ACI9YT_000708 [Halobacteriales archaeon]|jgi:hypothetical protein